MAVGGLTAGLIAAGTAVASTGANMIQTGKLNKKGRKFAAEQNEYNRQHAWQMFNATNDFNLKVSDPSFLMQRFKNAGLNPHLLYGQPQNVDSANSVNATSHPVPEQKMHEIDLSAAYNAFMNARIQEKTLENLEKQGNNIDANTNKTNADKDATQQDTFHKSQLFGGQVIQQGLTTDKMKHDNNKLLQEIENLGVENRVKEQSIVNMKQQVAIGVETLNNLVKEGKYLEAKAEGERLGVRIIEATMKSKIDAENAVNYFKKSTSGIGAVPLWNLPSLLIGGAIETIKNYNKSSEMQEKGKELKGKALKWWMK